MRTNSNKSDPSPKAEVPYNSFIIYIALLAFLSPLATLLWSVHYDTPSPVGASVGVYRGLDDDVYIDRRFLQEDVNCSGTPDDEDDGGETPVSTLDAIKATSIISFVVGFACFLGYEVFRRDPVVGKYVYDRKRLVQPDRTPPPLMLSRSLWRGPGSAEGEGAWRGPDAARRHLRRGPALGELFFLNMHPGYLRYARAADEARREREGRGKYGCMRTGCYHVNACNQSWRAGGEGFDVDEDKYPFYPGFSRGYGHIYEEDDATESAPDGASLNLSALASVTGAARKWRNTAFDLFPEDDPRKKFADGRSFCSSRATRRLLVVDDDEEEGLPLGTNVSRNDDEAEEGLLNISSANTCPDSVSTGAISRVEGNGGELDQSDAKGSQSSSVGMVAGSATGSQRLHPEEARSLPGTAPETPPSVPQQTAESPENETSNQFSTEIEIKEALRVLDSMAENKSTKDISGKEDKGMPDHTDSKGSRSGDDIQKTVSFQGSACFSSADKDQSKQDVEQAGPSKELEAQDSSNAKDVDVLSSTSGSHDTNNNDVPLAAEDKDEAREDAASDTDSATPLKYPSRVQDFFMPPGFHTWASVFQHAKKFFHLPEQLSELCSCIPTWAWPANSSLSTQPSFRDVNFGKVMDKEEKELLRCAGLDMYLVVRIARFGFDVTFWPFLLSVIAILPVYWSFKQQSNTVEGYFTLNINAIPDGHPLMAWITLMSVGLYFYIMRRLWVEWEVFITLRHDFLANGDTSFYKSNPSYLRTYRNTVMVESVPLTHRSDRNLSDVFESLFPGEIEHAEMLIDTSKLEGMLKKRQKFIEKYDAHLARYRYECWKYENWQATGKKVGCCRKERIEPEKPKVLSHGLFSRSREKEDAFTYYKKKVKEIDQLAEEEYGKIVQTRQTCRRRSLLAKGDTVRKIEAEAGEETNFSPSNLYALFVPSKIRQLLGEESPFFFGIGVVKFKSIAAKQSAVQCTLTGHGNWMMTSEAPDPRDLYWSNIGVNRSKMENRKTLIQGLLGLGIIFWSTIVVFINNFTVNAFAWMPNIGEGVIQGYLPALMVSIVLLWIPALIYVFARHLIHFKSYSECDEFVLMWNTGFRLANSGLLEASQCLLQNPVEYLNELAKGVLRQSTFLMRLMILAAAQETMLQLLQWRTLLKQAVIRPFINVNKCSRYFLDWLNEPPEREQGFALGFFAPVLSYGLVIGMILAFMSPIMLLVSAIFFWFATKVHMHNALYCFAQRCEGGGKIFYYWNRIVFLTVYSSIVLFAAILAIKKQLAIAFGFGVVMMLVTYFYDKTVHSTFVVNSLHLPMSIARIHGKEEEAALLSDSSKSDGGENFLYRHPVLNQENWNCKSTWKTLKV